MHRRNRTPCTFRADKGEKKKVLAQPGREEEEEEEWWGGKRREAQGNSTCLLVPASTAKWGWEPGDPMFPSRPSLVSFKKSGQTLHECLPAIQDAPVPQCPSPHPSSHSGLQATIPRATQSQQCPDCLAQEAQQERGQQGEERRNREEKPCPVAGSPNKDGWRLGGHPMGTDSSSQACVHFPLPPPSLNILTSCIGHPEIYPPRTAS